MKPETLKKKTLYNDNTDKPLVKIINLRTFYLV